MLQRIYNLLFYGGLHKADYNTIRDRIWESNRISLIIYSFITGLGMFILYLLSFFLQVLASSRTAYLICTCVAVVMLLISAGPSKRVKVFVPICVGLFTAALLAFGIYLGTVVEPGQASASFGILIFAAPLLFTTVPFFTDLLLLLSYAVYYFSARITQTPDMLAFNMSIVLPYGIVSLILCVIIMQIKVKNILLDYENKILSEHDRLTGMLNRRCYEEKLNEYRNRESFSEVLFYQLDINGLKNVNDSLGHLAGDELICAAARSIEEVFGVHGICYRIGGDEFFALIRADNISPEEMEKDFAERCKNFRGEYVSGFTVSVGMTRCRTGADVVSAVHEADRKMYASKKAFYGKSE